MSANKSQHERFIQTLPPQGIPLKELERQILITALEMANGIQKDAAELLSISPRVINYKIKVLGIDHKTIRRDAVNRLADTNPPCQPEEDNPGSQSSNDPKAIGLGPQ
jgi:hypothetical protein